MGMIILLLLCYYFIILVIVSHYYFNVKGDKYGFNTLVLLVSVI